MRLFLILFGIGPDNSAVRVAKNLKKSGHEIVYWAWHMESDIHPPFEKFSETIFHEFRDALVNVPPRGMDIRSFRPLSKELLGHLYETESVVMTMMNKHHGNFSVAERKNLYHEMLQYWRGVLEKYKPDAIIFPIVPHAVFDFVLYGLARHFGIKTIMFETAQHAVTRLLLNQDFKEGSRDLKKALIENNGRIFSLDDISPDLRDHYLSVSEGKNFTPLVTEKFRDKHKSLKTIFWKARIILKNIKSPSFFGKARHYLFKYLFSNPSKEYGLFQSAPDFDKNFIYFPLHYQPEASTSPLAGVFVNQHLIVEVLASSLPDGWMVYVKDHFLQWPRQGYEYNQHRFKGYYEKMAGIKNVKIMPIDANSSELIQKSKAVATCGGSAGWEGLLKLKPVLLFGYPWYRDCPGVFQIDGVGSCKKALEEVAVGFCPEKKDLINYLAIFDKVAIRGYLDDYNKELSDVGEEENERNVLSALLSEIEKPDRA